MKCRPLWNPSPHSCLPGYCLSNCTRKWCSHAAGLVQGGELRSDTLHQEHGANSSLVNLRPLSKYVLQFWLTWVILIAIYRMLCPLPRGLLCPRKWHNANILLWYCTTSDRSQQASLCGTPALRAVHTFHGDGMVSNQMTMFLTLF